MAYSALSALSNDSTLTLGGTVSETEHNTHRTNYRTLINNLLTEGTAAEKHRASGSEPTDKNEGIIYCDTTNDPAQLKFYKDGSENLYTLASLDAANAFTGDNSLTIDTISEFTADGGVGFESVVGSATVGTGEVLRTKVIEIGDWDMDADSNVSVTHGLTSENIRSVFAIIRHDNNNVFYPVGSYDSGAGGNQIDLGAISTTAVTIFRKASGVFDASGFDSTSYNRGWITILYAD